MIHELRTYTFFPGKLPAYMKLAAEIGRPVRGNDYGVNHGYWTTEFGPLNQVWHLWSYESMAERDRLRAALSQNERWTKEYVPAIRPLMERQDIRFLKPLKPLGAPAKEGGIYELRIYRQRVGLTTPMGKGYADIMPVREKYSRNIGLWTGESPQPNELLHMWNYESFEARQAQRAALFRDPEWLAYLKTIDGWNAEMTSLLLLPTPYSTMK